MALPTLVSAAIPAGGLTVVITLSLTTAPVLPASSVTGFTVLVNGTSVSVSGTAGSGSTITLTLAAAVTVGQGVSLQYTPGNVTDSASNALAAFGPVAVTNGSTQVASGSTLDTAHATALANAIADDCPGFGLDPINTVYDMVSGADIVRHTNGNVTPTSTIVYDVVGGYRTNTYDTNGYLIKSAFTKTS